MGTFRKRGDSWTAHVRVKKDGQIIHQEFATFAGLNGEALARDWASRLEQRIKQDGAPQRALAVTTLGTLLRLSLEKRDSIDALRPRVRSELECLTLRFADVKLADLTPKVFSDFAFTRKAEGAGPATVMHNLALIRSALNSAKVLFNLQVNGDAVSEAIKVLGKDRVVANSDQRTRRPTDHELTRLRVEFNRVEGNPMTELPMVKIMDLAIEFPRRIGELCKMRWEDLKGNVILLRSTKSPKGPRDETVPVLPRAAAIIASLPVADERILPYKSASVTAAWMRVCRRLRIEDLHFHDLRREGISRMFAAGYTIPEVAKVSGHEDWKMLKIYTEIKPQDVLDKFNADRQVTPQAAA